MPVSPQDFELYSRMTGAPMPTDAMSRMQMAPDVYNFTKSFARKPNLFEKTGNLVKNIGRGAVMALGAPLVAASEAENARMQEQLRNQTRVTGDSGVEVTSEPLTAGERLIDRKMKAKREEAEIDQKTRDDKQAKAIELLQVKKQGIVNSGPKPIGKTPDGQLLYDAADLSTQEPTTADNYQQDFVPNQTSSMIVDRKMEQGAQIADSTPNIAEVLSESQDSRQSEFADPEDVQKQMVSDMIGSEGKDQLAKFLSQKGLDQALLGAIGERMTPEPRIGDSSPLIDHPDLPGGEDDINLPSGTNTSPTTNLQEQTGGGESLNKRYINQHYEDMRKMEAQERLKRKSPSEKQINLLEQRAIANEEAIDSGFMNLDDEGRKKESIRLGSKFGIPNSTDMAEIRKDPEFIAAQESMKPKSVAEKTDDFTAKFVEGSKSDIVRGARGNKSLGITRIPATNGDAQVGFVLANKPVDQSPMYATTYGFGVAPGAESLLDNQLNRDTFSDYMKRGMKEAKQGKQRQAGEIFEYLIPQQRIITGDARLGDIVM